MSKNIINNYTQAGKVLLAALLVNSSFLPVVTTTVNAVSTQNYRYEYVTIRHLSSNSSYSLPRELTRDLVSQQMIKIPYNHNNTVDVDKLLSEHENSYFSKRNDFLKSKIFYEKTNNGLRKWVFGDWNYDQEQKTLKGLWGPINLTLKEIENTPHLNLKIEKSTFRTNIVPARTETVYTADLPKDETKLVKDPIPGYSVKENNNIILNNGQSNISLESPYAKQIVPVQHGKKLIGTGNTTTSIERTRVQDLPFKTEYIKDNTLPEGTERIQRYGRNGYIDQINQVERFKGSIRSSKYLRNETVNPVNQVVVQGTAKKIVKFETKEVTKPIEIKREADPNMFQGEEKVISQGKVSRIGERYDVTYLNGKEISRKFIYSSVLSKGEPKVIKYGTRPINEVKEIEETSIIPFETEYINDYDFLEGTPNKFLRDGRPGEKATKYRVTYHKGKIVSKTKVSERVTKRPWNKVYLVPKGKATIVEKSERNLLPLQTIRVNDPYLEKGKEVVVDEGLNDIEIVLYEEHSFQGKIVKEKLIMRNYRVGRPRKIAVGTKETERIEYYTQTAIIPYETFKVNDYKTRKGSPNKVLVKGVNGQKEQTYMRKYINGKLMRTSLFKERVITKPVHEVISIPSK